MKVSETERRRFLETLDHKMVSLDALQRRVAVRAGVKVSAEELDDDIARARAELHTAAPSVDSSTLASAGRLRGRRRAS